MKDILLSYVVICLCVIPLATRSFTIIGDNHISNIVSTELRLNNLAPSVKSEKITYFQNVINDQEIYTNSLIRNSDHSIQKRKANNFVNFSMKNKSPRPGQRSLVLVLDVTESMSTDLPRIEQGIKKIINKLSGLEENPIYNYIFVPFREENGIKETGPILVTNDSASLLSTLENVQLHGGDDCPENTLSALVVGLENALPNSFVLVFTDASANDFRLEGEVVELLQRKQATMSILLTGYCDNKQNEKYKVYERLTEISNGQVYDIRSDSIGHMMNDFITKLDNHHVLLTYFYAPEADSSRWEFSVDETVDTLELIISGEKPKVWIYSPDGKMVKYGTEIISLTHVKGYIINSPHNGTWQIDVESKSAHSVRITADSKLSFSYGFSVQSPTSMLDTHLFPLKGIQNILTIVSTEKVNLSEVHLLHHNFGQFKPLVLLLNDEKISNTAEFLYETDAFDPPDVPFKILVNGFNEKGIQINRTISTTLQKLDGPSPEVFLNATSLNITEGDSTLLKCAVRSVVPFTVWIQHEQMPLKERKINGTTTDLTYEIKSARIDDSGPYSCIASNMFGNSTKVLNVKVIWVPVPISIPKTFSVTIPQTEYVGTENQSHIEIPCSVLVEPKSSLYINWYFNETKINLDDNVYKVTGNNLSIFNLTKEHSGNYTCVVTADSETKSASTQLTVQFAPILQESFDEEIHVSNGESLTVNCTANSLPPAQAKWKKPFDREFEIVVGPLRIVEFDSSDEGIYECVLDNGIPPAAVRQVKLRTQSVLD